jgi:hypothetical protein
MAWFVTCRAKAGLPSLRSLAQRRGILRTAICCSRRESATSEFRWFRLPFSVLDSLHPREHHGDLSAPLNRASGPTRFRKTS